MKLSPNSHNYIHVTNIKRADTDEEPTVVTSVDAAIYANNGDLVDGSEITLTPKSGSPPEYEGTFPPLDLATGTGYRVRLTIVADGATVETDKPAMVTRE